MDLNFSKRHPLLASILWALALLLFSILGRIIAKRFKMDYINTNLVSGLSIFASVFVAMLYIGKSNYTFSEMGFRKVKRTQPFLFYSIFLHL